MEIIPQATNYNKDLSQDGPSQGVFLIKLLRISGNWINIDDGLMLHNFIHTLKKKTICFTRPEKVVQFQQ